MKSIRRVFYLSLLYSLSAAVGLLYISCRWILPSLLPPISPPSILVLAIDHLGSHELICNPSLSEEPLGFQKFCQESIRYTHAFTPSPLAAPALASILTGLYPHQHGLRTNGDFLASSHITATELAFQRDYRTAFFSGGPPILRKTGLHQGFEIFDDQFLADLPSNSNPPQTRKWSGSLYRPFENNIHFFLDWIQQSPTLPFFSLIYVPDLAFESEFIKNRWEEFRSSSFDGKMEDLDENLNLLIEGLKSQNRWDNTYIFLIGLNGKPSPDSPYPPPMDLSGLNTQVTTMIKPARKHRDEGLQWTVDKTISLVDIGSTLVHLMGGLPPSMDQKNEEVLPVYSMVNSFSNPDALPLSDRLILIESAWGNWRGYSNIALSLIQNHWVYFHEKKPRIYNTLIDRSESIPITERDPSVADWYLKVKKIATDLGYSPLETQDQIPCTDLPTNTWASWSKKAIQKNHTLNLIWDTPMNCRSRAP